jgi:NADH-quinone oxidoreductase subunit B
VVDAITAPFGNSTNQNRSSGLVSTGAVVRVSDRRP